MRPRRAQADDLRLRIVCLTLDKQPIAPFYTPSTTGDRRVLAINGFSEIPGKAVDYLSREGRRDGGEHEQGILRCAGMFLDRGCRSTLTLALLHM
jgi:hypothetical protein